MKKIICICFVLLLVFSLCSCDSNEQNDTAVFYYPKSECEFGSEDGVIGNEKTMLNKDILSIEQIIEEYLIGPEDSKLYSPLTNNAKLIEMNIEGNTLRLVFDDSITKVESTELTVALAALAMTCLDITNADEIHISTESVILNGEMTLIYTKDNILLWDNCIEEVPTAQTAATGE